MYISFTDTLSENFHILKGIAIQFIASAASSNDNVCAYRGNSSELHIHIDLP